MYEIQTNIAPISKYYFISQLIINSYRMQQAVTLSMSIIYRDAKFQPKLVQIGTKNRQICYFLAFDLKVFPICSILFQSSWKSDISDTTYQACRI